MPSDLDTAFRDDLVHNEDAFRTSFRGRFATSDVDQRLDLFVYFYDDAGVLVNLTTDDKYQLFSQASGVEVRTGALGAPISTGLYKVSFDTLSLEPGLYNVKFSGKVGAQLLVVNGQIGLREISRLASILNQARSNLYEMNGVELDYQLDPQKRWWTDDLLYQGANYSLNKINNTGPMITNFTMDNIVFTALVVDGIVIYALEGRARFEIANTFSYNDVLSLNIARGKDLLSFAERKRAEWKAEIKDWKLSLRPRSIGLGSQRLPLKILRPLSFLPNMGNIFGV